MSRVVLEIDLEILASNIRSYQNAVSPAAILAVVKAYGYGTMGLTLMEPVTQTCLKQGITRFAVSRLEEAMNLRKQIPSSCEIFLLGNFFPDEAEGLIQNRVTVSISDLIHLNHLVKPAGKIGMPVSVQILIDTGMGRLGIPYYEVKDRLEDILSFIKNEELIQITGLYSHLANAHVPEDSYTLEQIEKFNSIKHWVKKRFPESTSWEFHLANSWGAGNYQESHQDLVRVGIGLYGVEPSPLQLVSLRSAVTLKSRLISKRLLPAGHAVSYDCRHRLPRDTWVGTVAAGYADGIPLGMSSPVNHINGLIHPRPYSGHVLIRGKRAPVLGKVTMDYVMVDLNGISAEPGDEVIFFGRQGNDEITVRDFANYKKTHGYEVLCSLPSARVERVYLPA